MCYSKTTPGTRLVHIFTSGAEGGKMVFFSYVSTTQGQTSQSELLLISPSGLF